jgi:dsRNA-specific ribonuclease
MSSSESENDNLVSDVVESIVINDFKINDLVKDENNGSLIFNPYNSLNIEINELNIKTILAKYGIQQNNIFNLNLYKRAFIHRSYTKRPDYENKQLNITIVDKPDDCLTLKTKSNERLEFLGDGVLECITKYYLYKRFPKADEGFMTEKKIALVKNEHIGKLAYEMGLQKWFIISKHAEEKLIRNNLKKLGCLFEAFIGAIFLDFNKINIHDDDKWFDELFSTGPGFQMAQIFIENVFEQHVDWDNLINNDDNFKNKLQVLVQKKFKTTPHYLQIDYDQEIGYNMGLFICLGAAIHEFQISDAINFNKIGSFDEIQKYLEENKRCLIYLSSSTHKIKKKAEQTACNLALQLIT